MKALPESELNLAGATRYLDDLPATAGMLYGSPLTSPCARGLLRSIDATAALALDPSVRVLTAADIPGENQLGEAVHDESLLVASEWSYMGQCLALALASSMSLARRAAALIAIDYEELKPVTDAREAAAAGSFILPSRTMKSGDSVAAFARCAIVAEGRVESAGQEHVYLEAQGAIAERREGGRIYVLSGTQAPSGVQRAIARVLGLPMNDVEVEARRLGGAFGGKEDQAAQWAALAALGAARTGRTVKVYLNRREDMRWTGKRHPYSSDYRIGLDAEGRILAYEADYYQNSGACCDLSPAILSRTLFHAASAYRVPNIRVTGRMCRTNLPPFTAFRGFGAPQGVFVMECALDAAARKGGWDPVELRRKNLLAEGDSFHFGQPVADCRARTCVDRALELSRWDKLKSDMVSFNASHALEKRGAAMLPICFGVSFTKLVMNQGGALIHVYGDGSVSVSTGAVEMGQQVARKIQVIVARAFGISEGLVRVESTSTLTVANTYPTAASTGSDINGMAALAACEEIRGRLLGLAAKILGAGSGELRIESGLVARVASGDRGCEVTELGWKELVDRAHLDRIDLSAHGFYATPGLYYDMKAERGSPFAYHVYGCALVTATLDVLRGTYRFDEAHIVHDVGESIDIDVDMGQAEGAFAQGLGWAALEDLVYDDSGRLLSDSLSTYKLPDLRFMPPLLQVEFLQGVPNPKAVMRSKAIGEPPLLYGIAGYFAVLDALRAARESSKPGTSSGMASGISPSASSAGEAQVSPKASPGMYDLPMTPEKALDYIQGVRP
jgi:xanthine dehydrogenase large subunit